MDSQNYSCGVRIKDVRKNKNSLQPIGTWKQERYEECRENTYILLDVLCYFYELCRILTSPESESKYKQRVKILSDTT